MKENKPVLFILLFAGTILLIFLFMQPVEVRYGGDIAVLFPKGRIALQQRNLLFIIQIIMLLVVIPVYILTFVFSWKYNSHNTNAKYTPDWDDHRLAEFIWWGIPTILVLIIAALTWVKTYHLDPFKPIESSKRPLKIQVVALQWKWLFIYPEQKIASLNLLRFPTHVPLNFEITSDAPMNSFWIPQLGGQIYAMPKMRTKLHLIADEAGISRGSSANISGLGFSAMHFNAEGSEEKDFQGWIDQAKQSEHHLNVDEYEKLAAPSQNNPPTLYILEKEDLFDHIIEKYMHPMHPQKKKEHVR